MAFLNCISACTGACPSPEHGSRVTPEFLRNVPTGTDLFHQVGQKGFPSILKVTKKAKGGRPDMNITADHGIKGFGHILWVYKHGFGSPERFGIGDDLLHVRGGGRRGRLVFRVQQAERFPTVAVNKQKVDPELDLVLPADREYRLILQDDVAW